MPVHMCTSKAAGEKYSQQSIYFESAVISEHTHLDGS